MKKIAELISTALLWILISFPPRVFCMQPVACRWGSFGTWSECDPCTKLQTRSRPMVVYAQFGGGPCSGPRSETSSCETTQGCPLEDGCGDRFRCQSGRCISKSLLCNGDQDCEGDGLDERVCDAKTFVACPGQAPPPPDIEKLGLGFDVVTEKTRGSVINTNSFGGQCRTVYSGNHNNVYRLPLSVLQYNFLVTVKNDFSGEMFSSKWHYAKDKVEREKVTGTTSGFRNYDFHETRDITQTQKLTVLKNDIELAQFQSTSPKRSRSRSCSNPYPQNGGQHCIGDQTQTSGCDDEEELQYLKTMEPQCFDISLPARQKCDTPPSLVNGYILNPKDSYFVGCHNCLMWEDCDAERNQCGCKDSANCSTPGSNVCVRVGEDVTALPQSMSECEAGLRRCKGEKVSVINILPCDS
uniref:Complement component 7a n=1 Tax=Nothobranchius kuhntae TaxID=321403 RepID=A0A1A8HST3_NOTKU